MRLTLPESDAIYLSYNRMYQDGWQWESIGMHDFYVFADASTYQAAANTKLTAYFESAQGRATTGIRAALQTNSTYNDGWYHEHSDGVVFNPGQWYNIEAMVKMNEPGQANGEMRMWVDGVLQVERVGLVLRATGDEDIMFNQLLFGPWLGNGASVTKTFFTDDIMISDQAFTTTVATPIPGAAILLMSAILGLFGFNRSQSS